MSSIVIAFIVLTINDRRPIFLILKDNCKASSVTDTLRAGSMILHNWGVGRHSGGGYYGLCTKTTVSKVVVTKAIPRHFEMSSQLVLKRRQNYTGFGVVGLIRTIWLDIQLALTYY